MFRGNVLSKKDRIVTNAYVVLTENCNLKCKYCFEPSVRDCCNNMPFDVIHKTVDLLYDNAIHNDKHNINFVLFGGEPFLYPKGMSELITYAENKTKGTSVKATYSIITNGTVWNKDVEDFLELYYGYCKNSIKLQISVDGEEKIQNQNRPTINDTPSTPLLINTINHYKDFFRKHQVSPEKRLSYHACISKESLPYLCSAYKYINDVLGLKNGGFSYIVEEPWNDEDVKMFDEQLNLICVEALNRQAITFPLAYMDGPCACSAGKTTISVIPNGDIFSCERIYFMVKNSAEELNKFRIGNVLSKTPIDVTKKDYFRESETWKHCNEDCHICMAVNYLKTGDVNTIPDDYMIEFARVGNQYIDYFNAINGIQTSHRADYDENSDI